MKDYITPENETDLLNAQAYSDLLPISIDVLNRMPKPVAIVCGPISTGGTGHEGENIKKFEETINKLKNSGINVFGQGYLIDKAIRRIANGNRSREEEDVLLETFYRPLFESSLINEAYFIPAWETSYGANWEHAQMKRLGIKITYL